MPDGTRTREPEAERAGRHVRVAVVGAGFSGIGAAARLRASGRRDFVVLERAERIGGTWRDNTYPGCACDVPSHLYSYSFATNPAWPRAFSARETIHAYLEDVVARHGLGPHLRLGCDVREMRWDAGGLRWVIRTSRGTWTADVVVCATGPLSEPRVPPVPGLDSFPGPVFHSARWDHGTDLRGAEVAVVGTGASAVQIVPELASLASRLTLFQRTPAWVLPRWDRPISAPERWLHRAVPASARARRAVLWGVREAMTGAFTHRSGALRALEAVARANLRGAVADPELRARLTPRYRAGCKRILVSSTYYPALAQPHVATVASGLALVEGPLLTAEDGTCATAEVLVLATGFRTADPPVARVAVGMGGLTLAEAWGPRVAALRGTTVAGFPNFLMLLGPNTTLGNSSLLLMLESQLAYLLDYLRVLDAADGPAALDPHPRAVEAWSDRLDARGGRSVWSAGGCSSWYLDPDGRNVTMWPGTTREFRRALARVDLDEYRRIEATGRHRAAGADACRPPLPPAKPGPLALTAPR